MCTQIDILIPSHYCIDTITSNLFQRPVGVWSNGINASIKTPEDIQQILEILKKQNFITPECPCCRKKIRLGRNNLTFSWEKLNVIIPLFESESCSPARLWRVSWLERFNSTI